MDEFEPPCREAFVASDYRSSVKPIWCPGCGHFGVQAALFRAFAQLQLRPEMIAVVSGIGCSSRLPAYTACYGFHGLHGRALPVATGLKLVRPELAVVAVGGDGDGFSIGGNHFLHACRRNVDLTYVVMDNEVYGMTKGQPSPTTAPDRDSKMAPGGSGIGRISPLAVARAAGANFIARGYAGDPSGAADLLVAAIRHPGFSFVQILAQCVTYCPEQKAWKHAVHAVDDPAEAARRLADDDGLTTGIFHVGTRPPYTAASHPATAAVGDFEKEFRL